MIVRLCMDEEIEEVSVIWHESRKRVHTEMGFESERDVSLEISRRVFRKDIAAAFDIWVFEEGENLLGFLAIRGSSIDRMYVRPEAQRRGVGSALLDKARALSPGGLELYTHVENHGARTFYEKHGFGAVRFGMSSAPENEPDVEYAWRQG